MEDIKFNKKISNHYIKISFIFLVSNLIFLIVSLITKSDVLTLISLGIGLVYIIWTLIPSLEEPVMVIKDDKLHTLLYLWTQGYVFDRKDSLSFTSIKIDEIDHIEFEEVSIKKSKKKKKMMKIYMSQNHIFCIETDVLSSEDITKLTGLLRQTHDSDDVLQFESTESFNES